jgi:CheY-like chemotaxis protein
MPTILIVDDDPKFLDAAEQMLTSAGYDVIRASNGNQAVDLLETRRNEIALAIVDLALPGINGFEIIGAISRRPHPLKSIATTGVYKDLHFEMAGALGAHAAIRKPAPGQPLQATEWLTTVRQLIGEPQGTDRVQSAGAQGLSNDSGWPNGTKTSH